MKNAKLITIGLATAALVGLTAGARVQGAEPQTRDDARARQYGGSVDAWQHGYEHAYRDGADQGRQDRERRMSYNLRDSAYLGQRGYEKAFGDRNQYLDGYRQGYQAGYDEAFYGVSGQYGQLYGRPQAGGRVPAGNDPYADRQHSSTDMAFDAGYREGITLGQQDRGRNSRSNYQSSATYRSGDMGYRSSYGDRESYRVQFRDGVQRGYEDGYGRSQNGALEAANPSRNTSPNRSANSGRPGAGSRNGQGGAGGTFTVPANRQWTPTGIRVNQGDVLRLTSTGEIRFTGNRRPCRRRWISSPQVGLGRTVAGGARGSAHRTHRQRSAVRDRRFDDDHGPGERLVVPGDQRRQRQRQQRPVSGDHLAGTLNRALFATAIPSLLSKCRHGGMAERSIGGDEAAWWAWRFDAHSSRNCLRVLGARSGSHRASTASNSGTFTGLLM